MSKSLDKLTKEELIHQKTIANRKAMAYAFLIGVFIGIAIFAAANGGFGFGFFLPLFIVYLLVKNNNKLKVINKELNSR